MKRFALTRLAERDLDELKTYLANAAGPEITRRVMRDLREAFAFLCKEPQAGHSREDLTGRAIKFWPVYSYLVVYNPATNPVQILRLLDGRRNVEDILN